MAVEIPARREINEYQMKAIGRATPRNIVCGAIAVALVIATVALSFYLGIPASVSSWLFMIIGVPALMVGFWRPKNGQAPEKYIVDILKHFTGKNSWAYKSESPYLTDEYSFTIAQSHKEKRRVKKIKEVSCGGR
ncbi:hypothetical protein FACS1894104_2060 [Actinomycetota bacterium]|nr:hypothetical protein FACS1894104_2060 [Actinomycetota bacterium]